MLLCPGDPAECAARSSTEPFCSFKRRIPSDFVNALVISGVYGLPQQFRKIPSWKTWHMQFDAARSADTNLIGKSDMLPEVISYAFRQRPLNKRFETC